MVRPQRVSPCAASSSPSLLPHPCPLQYLMEGSYNKVFLAKGNIPAESYTFFIDILLDTIRCVGGQGHVEFRKSLDSGVRQLCVYNNPTLSSQQHVKVTVPFAD